MRVHILETLFLLLALTLCCACAARGEAADIVDNCTLRVSCDYAHRANLRSEDYKKTWSCSKGETLTVETGDGSLAQGVVVSFAGNVPELTIESDGQIIGTYDEPFKTNYIAFTRPVSRFTIIIGNGVQPIRMSRLRVLSEGELPAWVQRWRRMDGPADIMLVATHPDDELLWFGGLLPTYAGERGKKVAVVYTVGSLSYRHNELLDGLWLCGVRDYPEIGAFSDRDGGTVEELAKYWGGEHALEAYIVRLIRQYRPAVVVTQAIDGETGHRHHKLTVQAVIDAVTRHAKDETWDEASASSWGVWQPQKLYLHRWEEGLIVFDWQTPLMNFGGESALRVARRAFEQHRSQQSGRYSVEDFGKNDCRLFGLYWSSVGADEAQDDLLEHVR